MTTMQKLDSTLARFDRKSPRQAYAQICEEMGVHIQKSVSALLSDAPRDWDKHRIFDCNTFILGPKGCMAVLPLLLCSRSLRRVSLCSCQITDEFVAELAELLQDHGSIRSIDISDNPLVTVYSANPVITLLRTNKNIVRFGVENTHMGDNVSNLITSLCDKNQAEVTNYYADDYFRMKNLFNYLDGDGSGWVLLRSLVLNAPYPVLQEQLIEQIALKRPKKRSDNTISVNTFLELIYTNYKTDVEIGKREKEMEDVEYQNIVLNWKRLLEAMSLYNDNLASNAARKLRGVEEVSMEEDEEYGTFVEDPDADPCTKFPVAPPADLHRIRIRQDPLTIDDAYSIISLAAKLQATDNQQGITENQESDDEENPKTNGKEYPTTEGEENPKTDGEENPKTDGEENPRTDGEEYPTSEANEKPKVESKEAPVKEEPKEVQISVVNLRRAYRTVVRPAPPPNRFRFLREYEEDYIPPMMRAGSRLLSISKLPFFSDSFRSDAAGSMGSISEKEKGILDEVESKRWWALPPSVVRLIKKFFNQEVAKKPKRRQSTLAVSPRTQRDRAMQKEDIPVSAFLSAEFVTELETLRPRVIADKFAQYSIPIEVSNITLQEMVNCLEEYYVQVRIDKPFSLKKIRAMAVPEPRGSLSDGNGSFAEL